MQVLLFLMALACAANAATYPNRLWSRILGAEEFFPAQFDLALKNRETETFTLIQLLDSENNLDEIYGSYLHHYNKKWDNVDVRKKMFRTALLEIAQHNLEAEVGKHSWTQGVNQFTDMTPKEVRDHYTGYNSGVTLSDLLKNSSVPKLPTISRSNLSQAPASKNWRTEKKVSKVKNQDQCGSCYAFCSASVLESVHAIKHGGKLLDLSEQEIVDCSTKNGNNGCGGGVLQYTAEYMKGGLAAESDYKYEKKAGECRSAGKSKKASVAAYGDVAKGEENLKSAVATHGPIALAVATGGWDRYKSGIYKGDCGQQINHGVTVVGYTKDYWLIKNSWGTTWGEKGYIRLVMGSNQCLVSDMGVYMTAN